MFIQLGIISYKLIIPLLYPIFYQIRFRKSNINNGCYELFINYLSYLFAGIVFLIVRYNTNKSGKINQTINKQSSDAESPKEKIQIDVNDDLNSSEIIQKFKEQKLKDEKKELFKLKMYLISLALINLIPMIYEIIAHNELQNILDFKIKEGSSLFSEMLFYILFSKIFLGHKTYNHQKLSLVLMSICTTFIFSLYVIEYGLNFDKIINILFFSLIFGYYALYNVIGKKIFDSFIISPYYFMFIIGFISLAILLPYEIISYLINPNWKYNGIIRQITNNFSFMLIVNVVVGFFWVGGIWLTVYYFSPCHIIISESLSQFLTSLIENRHKNYVLIVKIIYYISYGIIIFSSLIYNEIIIINNENVSRDTKTYIIQRENIETELIEKDKKTAPLYTQEEDKESSGSEDD